MNSKATKGNSGKKPTRVYTPVGKLSMKNLFIACGRPQKLARQELKELQARLVRCSLADLQKP